MCLCINNLGLYQIRTLSSFRATSRNWDLHRPLCRVALRIVHFGFQQRPKDNFLHDAGRTSQFEHRIGIGCGCTRQRASTRPTKRSRAGERATEAFAMNRFTKRRYTRCIEDNMVQLWWLQGTVQIEIRVRTPSCH